MNVGAQENKRTPRTAGKAYSGGHDLQGTVRSTSIKYTTFHKPCSKPVVFKKENYEVYTSYYNEHTHHIQQSGRKLSFL